jgi:hypothetical protein
VQGRVLVRFKRTAAAAALAEQQVTRPVRSGLRLERLVGKRQREALTGKLPADAIMLYSITDGKSVQETVAQLNLHPGQEGGKPSGSQSPLVCLLVPPLPARPTSCTPACMRHFFQCSHSRPAPPPPPNKKRKKAPIWVQPPALHLPTPLYTLASLLHRRCGGGSAGVHVQDTGGAQRPAVCARRAHVWPVAPGACVSARSMEGHHGIPGGERVSEGTRNSY